MRSGKKLWRQKSDSGSKSVPRSATGAYFKVAVDGKTTEYTVK